jgi:phosphatidylglycerol:prolipoprotein diacylglycerol transferase
VARRRAAAAARAAKAGRRPAPVGAPGPTPDRGPGRPVDAGAADATEPQALVISHWFDSGDEGEPFAATVRWTGRRDGVHGMLRPGDTFTHEEKVEGVVPGSGPVSVSAWVYGLQPGEWTVTGELLRPRGDGRRSNLRGESLRPAAWSWRRRALTAVPATAVKTRWALTAPLAMVPAVIPGSLPILGGIGIVLAIVLQTAFLSGEGVPIARSLAVSLLALAFGLLGAKLWYAVLHPGPWRRSLAGGWSVDGFLVVAPIVAVAGLLAFDVPIGAYFDATTPGLFLAVAIGRVGCFLTGCCAGRPTRSRWGVWSSDRRVGARRIPAQLLESAIGVGLSTIATLLMLAGPRGLDGAVFVTAFVVYVLARQLLLRLRAERRRYSWRRSELVTAQRS